MNSTAPTITTTKTLLLPHACFFTPQFSNRPIPNLNLHTQNSLPKPKSIKCIHHPTRNFIPNPSSPPSPEFRNPAALGSCGTPALSPATEEMMVAEKARRLVSEFRSLPEPIDRVKRLLEYAASLPPWRESAREPESRVAGCATQVWVEAELDGLGRMRFRADSDSEISKGFCSCLIWMLDGGDPAEVLEIRARDLDDVNVGLYGKANSRVNTWHNVLLAMQRKTRDLVQQRSEQLEALLLNQG